MSMRGVVSLLWLVLLCASTSTPVSAQALPAPPRADRQPGRLNVPRVAPLPEAEWTDRHRALVEQYSGDGRADNQLRTLLNAPEIVEGLMPFTVYLTEASTLAARQRLLLILRTAWLCGSQPLRALEDLVVAAVRNCRSAVPPDEEIRSVVQGTDGPV